MGIITVKRKNEYKPIELNRQVDWPDKIRNRTVNSDSWLFISEYARGRLFQALKWGEKVSYNIIEQSGVLIGRVYNHQNETYSSVEDILLANNIGTVSGVEMTPEMFSELDKRLDRLNLSRSIYDQCIVVGWFHTHPNSLPVFMSGTDMINQRQNYNQDWQVSLVMNPHTNLSRCFFGGEAKEGNVIFYDFQKFIRMQNNQPMQPIKIISRTDGIRNLVGQNANGIVINNINRIVNEIEEASKIKIISRSDVPVEQVPAKIYLLPNASNGTRIVIDHINYRISIYERHDNDGYVIETICNDNEVQVIELDTLGNILKNTLGAVRNIFGSSENGSDIGSQRR